MSVQGSPEALGATQRFFGTFSRPLFLALLGARSTREKTLFSNGNTKRNGLCFWYFWGRSGEKAPAAAAHSSARPAVTEARRGPSGLGEACSAHAADGASSGLDSAHAADGAAPSPSLRRGPSGRARAMCGFGRKAETNREDFSKNTEIRYHPENAVSGQWGAKEEA